MCGLLFRLCLRCFGLLFGSWLLCCVDVAWLFFVLGLCVCFVISCLGLFCCLNLNYFVYLLVWVFGCLLVVLLNVFDLSVPWCSLVVWFVLFYFWVVGSLGNLLWFVVIIILIYYLFVKELCMLCCCLLAF